MLSAWRIVKRKYAKSAFDGRGAWLYGGRWNSPGTALVYTAQSQSLAILELLIHFDSDDVLRHYVFFKVQIPSALVSVLDHSSVPQKPGRRQKHPETISTGYKLFDQMQTREIGNQWVRSLVSPVLQVPSAIVPNECNFLLNPAHPDFRKIRIGQPQPFRFDPRFRKG